MLATTIVSVQKYYYLFSKRLFYLISLSVDVIIERSSESTSHVLHKNAVIRVESALDYMSTRLVLREYLIDLEFIEKLLSLKVATCRSRDHERDTMADPVDK